MPFIPLHQQVAEYTKSTFAVLAIPLTYCVNNECEKFRRINA